MALHKLCGHHRSQPALMHRRLNGPAADSGKSQNGLSVLTGGNLQPSSPVSPMNSMYRIRLWTPLPEAILYLTNPTRSARPSTRRAFSRRHYGSTLSWPMPLGYAALGVARHRPLRAANPHCLSYWNMPKLLEY